MVARQRVEKGKSTCLDPTATLVPIGTRGKECASLCGFVCMHMHSPTNVVLFAVGPAKN